MKRSCLHRAREGLLPAAPIAIALACLSFPGPGGAWASEFRRGDSNGDGVLDLSDAVRTIGAIFLGDSPLRCLDAADSNDSGDVDLSDPIYALAFLFLGGPAPPPPGSDSCGPDPTDDSIACDFYDPSKCAGTSPDLRQIGHVLNRIGYGPTQAAADGVRGIGLEAYIQEQLHPETIDESGNAALVTRENALFTTIVPSHDSRIVSAGEIWRYFKGTVEPPATWKNTVFDDSLWLSGETGIGMADNDDATVLTDMVDNYISVYLRKTFILADPSQIHDLVLSIDYDDGFVAYLNGTEVARRGLTGSPPSHTAGATNHEAGTPEEIDITAKKGLLLAGANVLAIQVHNTTFASPDLSMIPELIDRELLQVPPIRAIRGSGELQELIHVRGIYSLKQLQAVLGEFWENHFTTDLDKVADYFNKLQDSDASDSMGDAQSRFEASQVEFKEHQFFYDHALGNFGDLLLASATSPSMLIYLDNVLNVAGAANENYAREILELFAFGVDNRYTQKDIEQLAKCFTGWSICKVTADRAQSFPESAMNPPEQCGVLYQDTPIVDLGAGWKYLKGTAEPSPDPGDGHPTTAWTNPGFDVSAWLDGSTGIGYGDGDDTTVLSDMRNSYASVYLRRTFIVADPAALKNLILEVAYDDGFVAYLNGIEVVRSKSMGAGSPPSHSALAQSHEVTLGVDTFNLNSFRGILSAGSNVLAIQVHNASLDSADLSMLPRLVDREILPGSVENGDPKGIWTFHFDSSKHDTSAKTLFQGTPYQLNIPTGRTGMAGLADAVDVIRGMVDHPSVQEFISIKLIQKFVSDEITLATYKAGTVPLELRELLAEAIAAWNSTIPKGNIRTVLEAILDPHDRAGPFWAEGNYRSKVKTAVEFVNSSVRALDGATSGTPLHKRNETMGMAFFTRDDPDGWSELGFRWIDTAMGLARIGFAQALAENQDAQVTWNAASYISTRGLDGAEKIVDYFDDLLFDGTLPLSRKAQLLEFLTTDDSGNPLTLNPGSPDYVKRIQEFTGLLLSLPEWNFQ